ncbi:calcium-binding protein, partial [Streptomyces sp. NPDC126514]|uniref:calcium-binding protein n=1 Tax=Streptomyces sp. NPDC126514 TaxID=3155210 RepID=UPI00331A5D27
MHELSDEQLEALTEEATVDAYDEDEQLTGFYTMLADHLAIPFETTVLGTSATVGSIDLTPGSRIIAWCTPRPTPQGHRHPRPPPAHPRPGRRRMDPRLPALGRLSTADPACGE